MSGFVRAILLTFISASGVLLSGCERDPAPPLEPEGGSITLSPLDSYESNVLLTVLQAGIDAAQFSVDHDLILEEGLQDGVTYRMAVRAGQDLVAKEIEVAGDPRVVGVSRNIQAQDSESRQSTMAFDEGHLDLDQFRNQDVLKRLGIRWAHRIATGRNVTVAVLDNGVNATHVSLAGKVHPASFDFVDGDADPSDLPDGVDNDGDGRVDEAVGHGTHVAGLVSLVAPDAKLLVLRVLNSDGIGTAYDVARAMEYAADHGASVINLSLGMIEQTEAVDEALSYATDRGVLVVGSAGNWGAEDPEEYPSSSSKAWAVAASDSVDRAAHFTSFSSHVVITAPGTRIRSAFWNGGFASWSGTSMAAPLVSGTLALLSEVHPDWTRSDFQTRIEATADPVIPISSEQIGELGAGRLNVGAALAPDAPGVAGSGLPGEVPRSR